MYANVYYEANKKQGNLRRVFTQVINTRFFFLIATWGKLTPENAKIIVIKIFFQKIFRRIFIIKNYSK